ncbi:hypothetical protein EJB05_06265, partial [Eragrostis curvula]
MERQHKLLKTLAHYSPNKEAHRAQLKSGILAPPPFPVSTLGSYAARDGEGGERRRDLECTREASEHPSQNKPLFGFENKMFDDQDLGFFANLLGVFIFVLVTAYHFVMADPKFEGN